jgi:hypothetical protein
VTVAALAVCALAGGAGAGLLDRHAGLAERAGALLAVLACDCDRLGRLAAAAGGRLRLSKRE